MLDHPKQNKHQSLLTAQTKQSPAEASFSLVGKSFIYTSDKKQKSTLLKRKDQDKEEALEL